MKKGKTKKKLLRKKVFVFVLLFVVTCIVVAGYTAYSIVLKPNVNAPKGHIHVYIHTGSNYDELVDILRKGEVLKNETTFFWLAKKKRYNNRVLPGRYKLTSGMGNNELINHLRSGNQDPVHLTFNNIRIREQLARVISQQLEMDSLQVLSVFNNLEVFHQNGLNQENGLLLFIPNTYQVFWNISPEGLLKRMAREYNLYWNESRRQKAQRMGMTPAEVAVLASIVRAETTKRDEMPTVAGVYVNRLKRNLLLQADPTLVFALGDFTITRVLNRHKEIDSPYNTYKHPGLPPGPIALPEPHVIDAVLNYQSHDYFFFCAKDDFSGYHAFARTYSEHLQNARRYQQRLNELGIRQ